MSLGGCAGAGKAESARVPGGTFTIYSSGPRHGASAAAGEAVFAGQRLALEEARGRAGGRRVRLVRLASTRPGDHRWDPGTVEANAQRARKDPSAIAYLGELDLGGSAVSLPVTNRAGLLQVSATDGLTSLTRTPPGRPRAGPERYYPEDVRTFVRLVPTDLVVAEGISASLRRRGVRQVAILHGRSIAERELAALLVNRLRRAGVEPALVKAVRDGVEPDSSVVPNTAEVRAGAVVLVGVRGPELAAVLAGLARRQPRAPVLAGPGLFELGPSGGPAPDQVHVITAVLPAAAQPAAARRMLGRLGQKRGVAARPEALYGFEAMRLVLRAIDAAGPDRRGVVREGLALRERRTLLGTVAFDGAGDVRTRRLALIRLRGSGATIETVLP